MLKRGDKIILHATLHNDEPYYPPKGTIGVIKRIIADNVYLVQWPPGTTQGEGLWAIRGELIEKYEDNDLGGNNDN